MVYGYPEHERHGFLRNIASGLTKLALQKSMGAETARHVSAFRAFRTQARDAFANYHSPFISIDVVLTWATTRFVAIQVRHDPRQTGVSNYTFGMLFRHAMNMMTGFSILPLQLANLMGFLCTAFGGVVLVFVVGPLFALRHHRARIPFSGVDHRHFFRRPAAGVGHHRGISGPDAFPDDGTSRPTRSVRKSPPVTR